MQVQKIEQKLCKEFAKKRSFLKEDGGNNKMIGISNLKGQETVQKLCKKRFKRSFLFSGYPNESLKLCKQSNVNIFLNLNTLARTELAVFSINIFTVKNLDEKKQISHDMLNKKL